MLSPGQPTWYTPAGQEFGKVIWKRKVARPHTDTPEDSRDKYCVDELVRFLVVVAAVKGQLVKQVEVQKCRHDQLLVHAYACSSSLGRTLAQASGKLAATSTQLPRGKITLDVKLGVEEKLRVYESARNW